MPKHMGKPCRHESSEETTNCTRKCHDEVVCDWGEWGEKGDCSASCGIGWKRFTRVRHLQKAKPTTTTTTPKPTTTTTSITCLTVTEVVATEEPQKLYDDDDWSPTQNRAQGLFVGFALGAVVSGLAFAAVVRINRSRTYDRDLMLSPRGLVTPSYDGVPVAESDSRTPLGTNIE